MNGKRKTLEALPHRASACPAAFTLVELLVVIAIIAILAGLLLPTLSRAKTRAQSIGCLNNNRSLAMALVMYADDNADKLPYNLGRPAASTNLVNWAAGVLDWELTPDNTNTFLLTAAALGQYAGQMAETYHCPSDRVLSDIQRNAGWSYRVRSYSLNASLGNAGDFSTNGYNVNNPYYVQFFTLASIPAPSGIFAFVDEHPDSIGDGYFLNKVTYTPGDYSAAQAQWLRLPASYHNGAATFSFADGHAESHRWQSTSTSPAAQPDVTTWPIPVPDGETSDFNWVLARMSIDRW